MKRSFTMLVIVAALPLTTLLSMVIGSAELPFDRFLGGLFGYAGFETERAILLFIRLPRTLAAILAGAALSLAGVLLQHVMDNPLAGPNTVGVNAGAGFFTVLVLSLWPMATAYLSIAAFLGAFLTALLILGLARLSGGGKSTVILAGIACTSLFSAGVSFFSVLDTDVLSAYSAFSVGGLAGVMLSELALPSILFLISLSGALLLSRSLSALALGDGSATALGVRVKAVRTLAVLLAAMAAGAAISFAGLLGFVGLAVPHMTRRMLGDGTRRELIFAPILGATLLLLADLAARTLFAPSDIPVGIVTAALGAPFFLMLLLGRGRSHA